MQKTIYLVRGTQSESYREFSERIIKSAEELKSRADLVKIKVVFTAEAPPSISIIPFKKTKVATISIYKENGSFLDVLPYIQGFSGCYRVTEALPVAYKKTWPDGEITPGPCLLTLFNRKKGLDTATFLNRWHNSHTPLSLKIHPLWNYSRNVVDELLTVNSEKWEGIVEEQMRTDPELLNPFKFFGNPLVIIQRMIAVYTDTKAFLDYNGIQTYLTREVIIQSELTIE
jgi:hypothetical protein